MVKITILELTLQEGSIPNILPFGGQSDGDEDDTAVETTRRTAGGDDADASESGGRGKALALVGIFVLFVVAAAAIKRFSGDDDSEVEIETPDEPVGVTVDTDED